MGRDTGALAKRQAVWGTLVATKGFDRKADLASWSPRGRNHYQTRQGVRRPTSPGRSHARPRLTRALGWLNQARY